MVTTTGYQRGSKRLAETYGVMIAELRSPQPKDVQNKLLKINIGFTMRMPTIRDIEMQFEEVYAEGNFDTQLGLVTFDVDGSRTGLVECLSAGECSPIGDPPTPLHPVIRQFDPAVTIYIDRKPVAKVSTITAIVGDSDSPFTVSVGPGIENVAWMLKDAIGDTTIWFGDKDEIHVVGDFT